MRVVLVSKKRNITRAKMPNLGATIWRTILNIKLLCFSRCVPELLLSHLLKFIKFLHIHLNVTIKNVSWPHCSWTSQYNCVFFKLCFYIDIYIVINGS